ncbi:MAG: DUF1015 family protein [Thermoplasmatota archaeon]
MAAIAPFRAIHYDASKADPVQVTSPPYDVISAAERAELAGRDARNIVRVILPEQTEAGYADAAVAIEEWLEAGAFTRDDRPTYYTYRIHHHGAIMKGFFARVRVDPEYQEVRRHENTLKKPKQDRLHLRTATACDTEPIQLLYRDERGWVDEVLTSNEEDEPVLDFTDAAGMRHVVTPVTRPEALDEVTAQFEDKTLVIADGHHRYQTAVNHFTQTGRAEDGALLAVLVRDQDEGIWIDPTHRVVAGLDLAPAAALEAATAHYDVEPVEIVGESDEELGAHVRIALEEGHALVLDAENLAVGRIHRLRLKPASAVDEGRGPLDGLDITHLHERLLPTWGITVDNLEDHVTYTRVDGEAVAAAKAGNLVIVPPTLPVSAVLDVAAAGHAMPQKSTYFIPKMQSGLLLSPLDEPRPVPWTQMAGDGGKPPAFQMPNLE